MSIGSSQQVLVCVPVSTTPSGAQQQICPRVGGQYYKPQPTQAYLLNPDSQQQFDAAMGPFDYGYASALWTLSFSTIVGLYFVSHGISLVLNMIRRG
ncbi:hypothetical protein [Chromobacterium violaceum]|uniref:hypothetical protein n=1 Tax=Chromobacterium violaceum TaxID=536 RepID=UPI001C8BBCA3|nr:hypothetical protein [Chromobacterium violaceum]MBX9269273.1 hypothetical protein [Chromobacterium violaceum]